MLYSNFVKEQMSELKAKNSTLSAPEKMRYIAGQWRKQSNKTKGGMMGNNPQAPPALPAAQMHHTQISALLTPVQFAAFQAANGVHNFYPQNVALQFLQAMNQALPEPPMDQRGEGGRLKMKKPKKDAILEMFGVEESRPRLKNKKAMKKILNTVEKFTAKPTEDDGGGLKEGFLNTHKLLKWGLGLPEPENYVANDNTLGF